MELVSFHQNRKNIEKAPVVAKGKATLHSVAHGKATFLVGQDGKGHNLYIRLNADDVYSIMSVRDIMKAQSAA